MNKSITREAKLSKAQIPAVYASRVNNYDIWAKLTESNAQKRCLELADIRDGETILEVAVGTGLIFTQLLQHNPSGWNEGIDLTEAMLAKARTKAAQSGHNNYRLRIGDAYNLPFGADKFDLLVNNYMFDLLPQEDFAHILAEFKRVLRPGGRLVLVNMGQARHWYNNLWDKLYGLSSTSMGGCRAVSLADPMQATGFKLSHNEFISQMTFPSEIIIGLKLT
ncbi:MAG: methyltransferase domain-containing protein [Anaerolineales bacterium]|nr:methyltransferase domain-containing protein [Anaerolineales bacterium]